MQEQVVFGASGRRDLLLQPVSLSRCISLIREFPLHAGPSHAQSSDYPQQPLNRLPGSLSAGLTGQLLLCQPHSHQEHVHEGTCT